MYNNYQYRDYYVQNIKKCVKPINEEINKEKEKDVPDNYKLLQLEQGKLMATLF